MARLATARDSARRRARMLDLFGIHDARARFTPADSRDLPAFSVPLKSPLQNGAYRDPPRKMVCELGPERQSMDFGEHTTNDPQVEHGDGGGGDHRCNSCVLSR